jgi:hypothetical protein
MSEHDDGERPSEPMAKQGPSFLSRREVTASRVGTYTVLGAMAGGIPLPWIPGTATLRVRGALVHDIAARHHVSLTPEARRALADPSSERGPNLIKKMGGIIAGTVLSRLGPLAIIPPIRAAFGTFVLGHLFERYLGSRRERSVRLDVLEARRVRGLIDEALLHALTAEVPAAPEHAESAPEEMREPTTQLVDGILIAAAGFPGFCVRKLEAAFDDLLANQRG